MQRVDFLENKMNTKFFCNFTNFIQFPFPQTLSYNANDQVVPTMCASNPEPMVGSRKRRRSADELITPRGISVQHVASDARQLNANDIGQLQQFFRSHRSRLGQLPFRHSLRPTSSAQSSPTANGADDRNRSSAMSALFRHLPNIRIRDLQNNNDVDRSSNRFASPSISRIERSSPQQTANGSNINSLQLQFLRGGNTTLSELYRCAMASRNQQPSDASRPNDQVRLIRRVRRARPSTNTQGGR